MRGEADAREERQWEEAAGLREHSEFGPGFDASPEERNWGVALHLAGFAKYVVTPFLALPLIYILWRAKASESQFHLEIGREVLNFQISVLLYMFVGSVLTSVLIGYVILPLIVVLDVITMVIGATRASRGVFYRYPFCLRLIS